MKPRVAPSPDWEPTPRPPTPAKDKRAAVRCAPTLDPAPPPPVPAEGVLWVEPRATLVPAERREPVVPTAVRAAANAEPVEARPPIVTPPLRAAEPSPEPDPAAVAAPEGPLFRPPDDAPDPAPADRAVSGRERPASAPPIAGPAPRIVHPDFELDAPARRPAPTAERGRSRFDAALQVAQRFLDRVPWLLPTASFSIGWLSFFLFQRGEDLARGIAIIALLGWPWLLAENLLGRWAVERSKGRLSIGAVRFVTQQIQQEILFFALPFLFGAMVLEPGQMLFVGAAVLIAILVSLDPVYLQRIAPHAGLSSALHAYCTFIASLVVLPVALHMPLEEALPLSMAITGASLLLSLPRMLMSAPTPRLRLLGCAALAAAFPLLWAMRAAIPPAGLWVREARVTHHVANLEPGPAVETFPPGALHASGAVAFVAVRAPTGLAQAVVFDWHRDGALIDRIPAEISGGREAGFRTYSRKQNFPAESRGPWRVDLRTPQGQLIARMRFTAQ